MIKRDTAKCHSFININDNFVHQKQVAYILTALAVLNSISLPCLEYKGQQPLFMACYILYMFLFVWSSVAVMSWLRSPVDYEVSTILFVFCECETLKKEQILKIFQHAMLRRIFGLKRGN